MIDISQTGRCKVSVEKSEVVVDHVEFGGFNVTQALKFGEDISAALESHSPTTAWWSAMTIEERHRQRTFEEGTYSQYMAHCRYYAKLALKGLGDKETLEAVRDFVVILFSKEKASLQKDVAYAAWYGHLLSQHSTATAVKKVLESWTPQVKEQVQAEFNKTMYSWENDRHVTLDEITETELNLKKNVEALSAVVETFQQRGIMLSSFAADRRAEVESTRVGHLSALNKGLADRVR